MFFYRRPSGKMYSSGTKTQLSFMCITILRTNKGNKVISINGETFFRVSKTIFYTFLNSGDMKCPKTCVRCVRYILSKSQLLRTESKFAKRINENYSISSTIQNLSAQHAQYRDDDLA